MDKTIDKKSGSVAYNRLEMQVSQSLLFAIDLYESLNYLIVLDYYDDITIFDDENNCSIVSYYQMKTNSNSLTLHYIFKEEWLSQLYKHMLSSEAFIKELGLIVCNPIKDNSKVIFSKPKESFSVKDSKTLKKICDDIGSKLKIPSKEVDLRKFVYIRTQLTRENHREIVKNKLNEFLYLKNPDITLETANTIFNSLLVLLSGLQSTELEEDADIDTVKRMKSISRSNFDKIIKIADRVSLPDFSFIERFIPDELKHKVGLAYVRILEDCKKNIPQYRNLFIALENQINIGNYTESNIIRMAEKVSNDLKETGYNSIFYSAEDYYVETLAVCILLKGKR